VASGEQADEHPLEHRFLTRDDPPDLVESLLELLQQLVVGGRDDLLLGQSDLLVLGRSHQTTPV
jgi:hypothetical protein